MSKSLGKKYEIVEDQSISFNGKKLYRIRALRDITQYMCRFRGVILKDVKKGELGGYVENESNLSHEGKCWIYDDSIVYDKSVIYDNAIVMENSVVSDISMVHGESVILRKSTIDRFSEVSGKTLVDHSKIGNCSSILDENIIRNSEIIKSKVAYSEVGDSVLSNGSKVLSSNIVRSHIDGDISISNSHKINNVFITGKNIHIEFCYIIPESTTR